MGHTRLERWTKYLFVLPGTVWVLVLTIFPLLYSLWMSFHNYRIGKPMEWVGLANYAKAFHDYAFWGAAWVTVLFVIASVILTVSFGFLLALLSNQQLRRIQFFRTSYLIPLFTSSAAMGYLFITVFANPGGPVNQMLAALGLSKINILASTRWSFWAITAVDVWQWTPFAFLVLLARLQTLPQDVYEAVSLETRSGWQVFRHVTWPLTLPTLLTVLILRVVEAFKVIDIPFTLTNGGPGILTRTYSFFIYKVGLRDYNLGYASALSFILLAAILILAIVFFRQTREIQD